MRDRGIYKVLYLVFSLGTAHILLLCGVEVQRWFSQERELKIVAAQTAALQAEVLALKEELKLADDPAYLERKSRSLGYVYPNEELHASPH